MKTSEERYRMVNDKYEFTGYTTDDIEPQLIALMIKHKIISAYQFNETTVQTKKQDVSL